MDVLTALLPPPASAATPAHCSILHAGVPGPRVGLRPARPDPAVSRCREEWIIPLSGVFRPFRRYFGRNGFLG
ncbi:hypothetical protein GCM10010151_35860 [Actinoallomurus spadix]|uniref:Secreted protein n=1 Tax=Actinoallomurus spadix TaxID=79912 RepID=A0ABP3GDN6_9ACTN